MSLETDFFDLWVFRRRNSGTEYLLLHASQEKADKYFGGGRFWQTPGDKLTEGERIEDACQRLLASYALNLNKLWAAEHVYTIYNRRYQSLCVIPVFAAEVTHTGDIPLSWEFSDYGWFSAEDALAKLSFRGLIEGLASVREYVSDIDNPRPELQLI